MKNSLVDIIWRICFIFVILLTAIWMPAKGIQASEVSDASQIKAVMQRANITDMSVVIVTGDKVSYGGNRDTKGLYQIGSMTKAYTALGIMLLVDNEKISLDDTVSTYIEGFTANYRGDSVEITVDQLLAQTSGYTNSEKLYPSAAENMTLEDWAKSISGKELQSSPGVEYAYSNVNYNLLGLIIEKVSGHSYKEYMEENVLIPLGLNQTYCGKTDNADGIVTGSRQGFLMNFPYEINISEGMIPAGYCYSNIVDMGRWLQIQMGMVTVPEILASAINEIQMVSDKEYFGGWELTNYGALGHSGGTPNYSSRIVFDKDKQIGVCVLANLNAAGTVDSLCNALFLEKIGERKPLFSYDIWRIIDFIFTGVTVLCIAAALFMILKRRLCKLANIIIGSMLLILTVAVLIIFPLIFQASWWTILSIWAPYSMASGVILLCLCTLLSIWKLVKK
ncbi:serine hydrolase domain-containing protein [Bacillus benzoevorans]|uniref:Putative ATP-binding cassette transporter n=1 Tax=Bacillus benzoevorans TaxID=1456 RepID=A0A7X0HUC4_9BACI|nr:serine hydrolase domain-containing protein [Bacillus benzoevorans]MBB6447030.1 putative ATP-binding cassette transporter [Bacillus benzoevorans]